MIRRPPRSTRTDTLFPYTTLFRFRGIDLSLAVLRRLRRLRHRAAAVLRGPLRRHGDLPRLSGAPVDPVHPACHHGFRLWYLRYHPVAHPHLPYLPHPVLHLAADGLFPLDPLCAGVFLADRLLFPPAFSVHVTAPS